MTLLETTIQTIPPLDQAAMAQARYRQDRLTKPTGSLGRLEDIACLLAGMTGQLNPPLARKHIIVMAGDHGVTAENVTAYPPEVTPQMVLNFLAGPDVIQLPAIGIIETGIEMVNYLADSEGVDMLITGEMGIGNTTPSAAMTAAFIGLPPAAVTGRGGGVDDAGLQRKIRAVERALAVNRPDPADPLDVLAKVGGLEIGGIAGTILGAAARRIPVMVDGFISTVGALLAAELAPAAKNYMLSGHNSVERGHQAILTRLGLAPMLDLGLRLGEGTGAALSAFLVEAAVKALNEMATYEDTGILDRLDSEAAGK
jgi:nicotinate-nucleotide--dimethylbenzimidazole phosphoribosyltransferase